MKNKLTSFIFFIIIVIIVISGCGAKETVQEPVIDTSNEQVEQENDQKEEDLNSLDEIGIYAPLTGLPVAEEIKDRIIGVMINNHPDARPQSGLNQADIVYEILAEGSITRFIAIYQSKKPEVIGPIRSIRPYNLDVINGFDALIVHSGASEEAYATIFNDSSLPDLDEIRRAQEAYYRVNFRQMPHNLYTSTEKILAAAARRGFIKESYIPEFIFLSDKKAVSGDKVELAQIEYYDEYRVTYQYNKEQKIFERFINDKPHIDLETREQLTAKNILIIKANHQVTDAVGRRNIDLFGPGAGKLLQNGVIKDITWERVDGVIRPFVNGEEQGLYRGQTWVIVVDNFAKLTLK